MILGLFVEGALQVLALRERLAEEQEMNGPTRAPELVGDRFGLFLIIGGFMGA
jgi:hypothetical protein